MDAPLISVRNLRKSYGTTVKTHVLKDVSLDIMKGEFVALVGQSGSGKSTLLNIIGGLDIPDSGEVTVNQLNMVTAREPERAQLRNRDIGFVFQAFNLLDHLSCLDNVILPSLFRRDEAATATARGLQVLERVGLGDYVHRYPSELSGGQKQRVAIARALFSSPKMLLCDEPTGNLDSETGGEVIEFFRELNQQDQVTLIVVTHERRVSNVAGRVIAMRDGRVVPVAEADFSVIGGPA